MYICVLVYTCVCVCVTIYICVLCSALLSPTSPQASFSDTPSFQNVIERRTTKSKPSLQKATTQNKEAWAENKPAIEKAEDWVFSTLQFLLPWCWREVENFGFLIFVFFVYLYMYTVNLKQKPDEVKLFIMLFKVPFFDFVRKKTYSIAYV